MDEPIMEQSATGYAERVEDELNKGRDLAAMALASLAIASAVESLDLTINQINQQKESA